MMSERDPSLSPPQPSPEQLTPQETDWQRVFDLAEQMHVPEDPAARAADVARMTADDLVAMVSVLHSALAPNAEQSPTDAHMKVSSPDGSRSTELMDPDERYGFFQHAAGLINELGTGLEPGKEADFLERASNIVAFGTVLAHPFEDGNGRTARFAAHLLRDGFNGSDEAKKDFMTLGTNRPAEGFRIFSFVPRTGEMDSHTFLKEVAAPAIPLAADNQAYQEATTRLFTTPYKP